MRSRAFLAAWVVAIAGSGAACAGSGSDKAGGRDKEGVFDPLVLTLAAYAQPDPEEFVSAVARLSDGSIRIERKVPWRQSSLDYERETIADVRRGDVDLAFVGARVFDLLGVTSFQGLLAPFLVDSLALEARVLRSPLGKQMLAGVNAVGVEGLGLSPGPLRRPIGVTRPFVDVADYRGATFGVRASRLIDETVRTLGASPRLVTFPRDFRVIDGTDYELSGLDFSRYDKQARTLASNVVFWPRTLVLIANRKTFAGLTSRQRGLLRKAASAALEPALARVAANDRSALTAVCRRGGVELVRASRSQLTALRGAVEPVYARLRRDAFSRRVIEEIESFGGASQAETLRCPRSVPQRSEPDATPLDGTWEWAVTLRELLAAGDTPPGADRNVGRWRLVLKGGRYTARNLDTGDAYSGAYRVTGNRLVARGTGDPGPVAYIWSVYHDQLTLRPVDPKLFAAVVVAKPLIRAR